MIENTSFKCGWDYACQLQEGQFSSHISEKYLNSVISEINKLSEAINSYSGSKQSNAVLGGFIAEEWHAGTLNINAVAAESFSRAFVEKSTEQASVDISTNYGSDYSLKYLKNAELGVKAQSKNVLQNYHDYLSKAKSRGTNNPMTFEEYLLKYGYDNDMSSILSSVYNGQGRIIPSDQLASATQKLKRLIATESCREGDNRLFNLKTYEETLSNLSDRLNSNDGIESIPLSKAEAEAIAALCKSGDFTPEDFGITLDSVVIDQYILNQALKGGISAATLSLAIQLVPDFIELIKSMMEQGQISKDEIFKKGLECISSSSTAFITGFLSSEIYLRCMTGAMGSAFININAPIMGSIVAFSIKIIKECFKATIGKKQRDALQYELTRDLIITISSVIGGSIAVSLLPIMSGIAFTVGSIIGSVAGSLVCNASEKIIISLCVDTGFTLFGIVKQDYRIPLEILKKMRITIKEVDRIVPNYKQVTRNTVDYKSVNRNTVERIETVCLKRGIIAFNTVGYFI